MFKYFSQKNFSIKRQYLENSQSEQFPYNIILGGNDETDGSESGIDNNGTSFNTSLFFVIPQDIARRNTDLVSSLAKSGTVVLSANDRSGLPSAFQSESFTGLRTFLHTAPSDAIIIIISESDMLSSHEMQIIPGGNGFIAACEVTQALIHAGQLTDFDVSVQSFLLSVYRLKWVDGSEAAALCLENGFQASELVISDKTASPQAERYAASLSSLLSESVISEGTQYSIITTGTNVISISERLYTILLFVILGIALLANCLFSFMFGKYKIENRIIFLRWWYVGPLLVFITFALTYVSQLATEALFPVYQLHPFFALSLKTALIILFFLLLCEIRYIVPLAKTDYLYAFFMTLAATLDVFVFTSVDMPLLLPFSIFYIIMLCARPVKKWWINLIILIATSFPPAFTLIKAAPFLRNDIFTSFTDASPAVNFFVSILLLPYLLQFIRIFIGLGLWDKAKGKKRIIIETSIICGLIVTMIFLATFCHRSEPEQENDREQLLISEDRLQIKTDASIINGMLNFTITLSDDIPVLKYTVSVSTDDDVPLYSANLPFSFGTSAGEASFRLDENPCNGFVVSGMAPASFPYTITISAWQKDGESFVYEKHAVILDYDKSDRNSKIRSTIE